MSFRPGCFGSPLCYSDVSLPCTLCPHKDGCGQVAEQTATELRDTYGIKEALVAANRAANRRPRPAPAPRPKPAPVPRHGGGIAPATPALDAALRAPGTLPGASPYVPATPPAPHSAGLSVKSLELQSRLHKRGIDLRRAIGRGANPFDSQPPAFMRVLTRLLLEGSFTREQATSSLMSELNWAHGSAASHVTLALPVLVAEGVARLDGKMVIKELMQ